MPDCSAELQKIYGAIMALTTGERAVTVTFGQRSVTYTQAQTKLLQDVYRTFYRQCGAGSGLPDFSQSIERGPPAIIGR